MKKVYATMIAFVALISIAALADGPQPSVGLYWYDSHDPSISGMAAPLNQLLVRTDLPSLYYKSGAANTAWTKIGSVSSGGTVTSVACGTGLLCAPSSPITTAGTVNVALTPTTCAAGMAETATAADGTSTCSPFGNVTSGTLTANTIPKATGAGAIGNSSVTDDGTTFAVATSKLTVNESTGNAQVGGNFQALGAETLNSAMNANSNRINNLTDPASAQDAATKNYVDSQVGTVVSSAWFGPGTDGNVHITAGTTTLTRDEYYDTITIDDGGIIDVAGFTLYAKTGIVGPATNVSGGAVIKLAQLAGNDGTGSSGGSTVACKSTDGTVGEGVNCTAAAGGFNVGPGGSSNNGATARWPTNYKAGEGGNGGAGATAAGTGSINSTTLAGPFNIGPVWGMIGRQPTSPGSSPIRGGGCGGGGGGSPTGGGGSGGCGGGYVAVSAKTITNPTNVTIDASGTKGGNGFTTGNTGGGGGGGGGYAILVYSTGLPNVFANGGAGGTGHNGGANGSNGFAGQVQILQVH